MAKSKEGLGLLLLGDKPKGGSESSGSSGDDEAKTMAAKAFLKAIKRDSPEALVTAFEELIACCDDDYDAAEEPDEDED